MRRFLLIFRQDFVTAMLSPPFWVLVVIVGFTTWGLSSGNVTISSGNSAVGGTKAWITSEFALAQIMTVLVSMFYSFFIVVGAGMTVIRDQELKVGEILHATRLKPGEYIWGKFGGVLAAFFMVLLVHLVFTMFIYHAIPRPGMEEIRGPFELLNYLRPALFFSIPAILFYAGIAFFIGERTRKPILVFFFPVAVILVCAFFLWNWSPTWLDYRWNRFLMLIDPAGFRWLNETWLTVDRGVDFYNSSRIEFDGAFTLSRLGFALLGLGGVLLSQRGFSRGLRSSGRVKQKSAQDEPIGSLERQLGLDVTAPLAKLKMQVSLPGLFSGLWSVARAELKELRSQPGLYLFVPLILMQTIGSSLIALGAFGTPLLLTSGTLAVRTMNTLTLLNCLLLLFYTVESLQRERSTGLHNIYYATPVKTSSILFGKALANSFVGMVVVMTTFLACAIAMVVQSFRAPAQVAFELSPFVLAWGLLLLPTFLVWTSLVTMIQSLTRNRYTTYAISLAALIATGYYQFTGEMNWVGNWNLWSVVTWSDMGIFELNRVPLIVNRLLVLGLSVLFTAVAVRFFGRQDFDAARTIHRLHPRSLLKTTLRLSPYSVVPLLAGVFLQYQVGEGFQGAAAEKESKDYWRKNLATYKDYPLPAMKAVDIAVEIKPQDRWFQTQGSYEVVNLKDHPLVQIPVTAGSWENIKWSLNGSDYEPEDRAGLFIFKPEIPLQPGESLTIGFSHDGTYPKGITSNGGGAGQFILPAGVVLNSFGPIFAPSLGYSEGIGVDDENQYEPREYPEDYYKEILDPAFGSTNPFTTKIQITIPAEYTANSVGTLTSETVIDGKRTVIWESDHPVKIFNIVAARYDVKKGDGTAIYYHPEHDYNLEEMLEALDAARRYYSEWFYPFPWNELRLNEFPNLATYAQGFATNITFSEGIGFLTRSEPKTNVAFLVTAHESAHQWWGNLLTPGRGPGGNILSEGMSHFSTILLMEQGKGLRDRIEFCKRIEERYGDARQVDSERPMIKIDGSRPGDTTVTYDKGGWVFWMLLNQMGREPTLAGMQEFIRLYLNGPDYPLLQDFVVTMREFATDQEAFDSFVEQWFLEVVVPEYRFSNSQREEATAQPGNWTVTLDVENRGTGLMPVEVAAVRGERFLKDGSLNPEYRSALQTVTLGAGESTSVEIQCDFEPDRVITDPDARVLQLEREKAIIRF